MPVSTFTGLQTSLRGLIAQQEALEYLFFDLSACVAVDTVVPPPPPPPTK